MRPLKSDPAGTARWLEREAKALEPWQAWREFVRNGFEAGAGIVALDGWADPDTGRLLARVTDDGSGMTSKQLVDHLSTLHVQTKGGANHGVGARIAALPGNPAGVTFASRTDKGEGMVRLIKSKGGIYGVKEWRVEVDGYEQLAEVVSIDDELERLKSPSTGTAVIMHGHGRRDTWDALTAFQVTSFLAGRFYQFPGDAQVHVYVPGGNRRTVRPFGHFLARQSKADGVVPFKNVGGLSGEVFWWTLPKRSERKEGALQHPAGGVGLVVDDEVFEYSTNRAADFGLIYGSVAKRVAILVRIDGAAMDTARGGVVLPGRMNKPWKQLGQHFAAHMPDEIDELISNVSVRSSSFDAELAKLLDADWMKKLDPVKVPVRANEGDPLLGDDAGDASSAGDDLPEPDDGRRTPEPKSRKAAERREGGAETGKLRPKVVTPRVEFLAQADVAEQKLITYLSASNVLQVAFEFPPYDREIGRWVEDTGHSRGVVTLAVQKAYEAEFAATVIDANAQSKHGASPELIEELKSDAALYTKALGFQSLSERVAAFIKDAASAA